MKRLLAAVDVTKVNSANVLRLASLLAGVVLLFTTKMSSKRRDIIITIMQNCHMVPRILPRPFLPTSSLASLNSVPSSLALLGMMVHSTTPLLAYHIATVAAITHTKTCISAHMAEPMSTSTRQITTRPSLFHKRATHVHPQCVISHLPSKI